jgi:error-prone DNA polymerase
LLNNQPMGFYSSATLVNDARRHGIKTRPVCVQRSGWRCEIEPGDDSVRLGLNVVRGLSAASAERLLAARAEQPFASLEDFRRRAPIARDEMRTLASLGALNAFAAHRRDALWQTESPRPQEDDLLTRADAPSPLRPMSPDERLQADYAGMSLTTGPHAMALLRPRLPGLLRAVDLRQARHGSTVRLGGSVICRQRPGTAKGFVFLSLEDETGIANVIVTPQLFEERRLVITQEAFLLIEGEIQDQENTIHLKARRISPLPHEGAATAASHDFR